MDFSQILSHQPVQDSQSDEALMNEAIMAVHRGFSNSALLFNACFLTAHQEHLI